MSRWLPHPVLTLVLAGIWVLLANDARTGSVVAGLLLGSLIPLATGAFWPDRVVMRRPLTLLRLVGRVLWDILIANITVARRILGRTEELRPGFVSYPLTLRSDIGISLLVNTISITPGTVSAYLSRDRRSLLVHALDVADPEALVADIRARYEQPLQEIFEP